MQIWLNRNLHSGMRQFPIEPWQHFKLFCSEVARIGCQRPSVVLQSLLSAGRTTGCAAKQPGSLVHQPNTIVLSLVKNDNHVSCLPVVMDLGTRLVQVRVLEV